MTRVRSGTRVGRTNVAILKQGAQGGLRKMRCPHCHGLAIAKQDKTGKTVYQCSTAHCRATFSAGKL